MGKNNIFILSGPIHSGKTTHILEWAAGRSDVRGIVTPVIEDRRVFLDLETREFFPMEAEAIETNILTVGKYKFSLYSFMKAEKIISDGAENNQGWVIIDEIGPLELQDVGFSTVLKNILKIENRSFNLLLVIRDSILEDALKFFDITKYELIEK